jgi:type I restriction enzyme S subunit
MSSHVPDGWRINTIDEIAKTSAGGTPSTQKPEYWEDGDIPWMSSGEVHKKRVRNVDKFITKQGYKNSSAKLFPPKTLLMALAGQGKTRGTVAISEMELTTNQSIAAIMITDDLVHPDYVFQNLDGRYNELRSVSGGSGRAGLNLTIIGEQVVLLPPLPEQQKIAQILTSVDEVIEKTQAQIDKLKDLKTGMMQELLTNGIGHVEFKDSPVGRIPVGWEVCTVESVLTDIIDYRGKAPPKSESGIPLITAKNIRKGFINEDPKEYIFQEQFDSWMVRGMPKFGDVFITTEAPLGNVAKVPSYKFAIGQRVLTLRPKESIICTDFLFFIMQSEVFRKELELQSTGSTVAGIKQSTFRKVLLPVPAISEQKEIAKHISAIISRTTTYDMKLKRFKDLKKALMQDLLTGKVRVNTEQSNSSLAVG